MKRHLDFYIPPDDPEIQEWMEEGRMRSSEALAAAQTFEDEPCYEDQRTD